jgi:hypothetical protein
MHRNFSTMYRPWDYVLRVHVISDCGIPIPTVWSSPSTLVFCFCVIAGVSVMAWHVCEPRAGDSGINAWASSRQPFVSVCL